MHQAAVASDGSGMTISCSFHPFQGSIVHCTASVIALVCTIHLIAKARDAQNRYWCSFISTPLQEQCENSLCCFASMKRRPAHTFTDARETALTMYTALVSHTDAKFPELQAFSRALAKRSKEDENEVPALTQAMLNEIAEKAAKAAPPSL
eukprot:5279185-Pleurochrysis_carterae.AAC.3